MHSITKIILITSITLAILASQTSARPAETDQNRILRFKRQSDQRLAELETLLALQKYGISRHRADHRKHASGSSSAGFGLVDFNVIGRRKKSLRFSPAPQNTLEEREEGDEHNNNKPLVLSESADDRLSFRRNTRAHRDVDLPTLQESPEDSLEQMLSLSSIELRNDK